MMAKEQAEQTAKNLQAKWFCKNHNVGLVVTNVSDSFGDSYAVVISDPAVLNSRDTQLKPELTVTEFVSDTSGHNVYMAWQSVLNSYRMGYNHGKQDAVKQIQSIFEREVFPK